MLAYRYLHRLPLPLHIRRQSNGVAVESCCCGSFLLVSVVVIVIVVAVVIVAVIVRCISRQRKINIVPFSNLSFTKRPFVIAHHHDIIVFVVPHRDFAIIENRAFLSRRTHVRHIHPAI